jgi:hypothetical protein
VKCPHLALQYVGWEKVWAGDEVRDDPSIPLVSWTTNNVTLKKPSVKNIKEGCCKTPVYPDRVGRRSTTSDYSTSGACCILGGKEPTIFYCIACIIHSGILQGVRDSVLRAKKKDRGGKRKRKYVRQASSTRARELALQHFSRCGACGTPTQCTCGPTHLARTRSSRPTTHPLRRLQCPSAHSGSCNRCRLLPENTRPVGSSVVRREREEETRR